jgi:hypothetical protein
MVTLNPEQLTHPGRFRLVEGDWDTALPLMREGCGVLVSPAIAARYGAGVGDPITVTGRTGPVTCTVAATGAGGFAPMSLIGPGGFDLFVAPGKSPDSLQVRPLPDATDADIAALDTDLHALSARYGEDRAFVGRPEDELQSITGTSDQLVQIMNGLLLLAIGAGALGSVNTTLVSILERQRELALLRSLGATRRQIAGLIVGESAITGLLGALLGLLAGRLPSIPSPTAASPSGWWIYRCGRQSPKSHGPPCAAACQDWRRRRYWQGWRRSSSCVVRIP